VDEKVLPLETHKRQKGFEVKAKTVWTFSVQACATGATFLFCIAVYFHGLPCRTFTYQVALQ
jgi:hypothetical protein